MSIFDIISLFGGLALFLYGMRLMGDSLKENSSGTLKKVMEKVLNDCEEAFLNRNTEAASLIEPKVRVVVELVNVLINNHFSRMSAGECSLLADSAFTNLMREYKRIGAICSNVGIATMVRVRPELADHEHLFFETLDKTGDSQYNQVLEETHKKYFDLLSE